MARCANGEVESPPRRLGRRKTARAARPSSRRAVETVTVSGAGGSGEIFEAGGRRCVLQAASARRGVEKLVSGGLQLLSGWVLGVDSERAGGHALGGGVVDYARGRGMW